MRQQIEKQVDAMLADVREELVNKLLDGWEVSVNCQYASVSLRRTTYR